MDPEIQKWTLIASIVGAAAWIPPLISLAKKLATKPVVTITPASYCEVGFTELGPILNLQVAITADNQNVLIEGIQLRVTQESGHTLTFAWHELTEVKGQMIVPGVTRQPIIHEMPAIAVKVLTTDFRDVVLRSRVEEYSRDLRIHDEEFQKEQRRLLNNAKYDANSFYVSKPVQDRLTFMKSKMVWKSGKYIIDFLVQTRRRARIEAPTLSFSLSDEDILLMQANAENVPQIIKNECLIAEHRDSEVVQPQWHWLGRRLTRLEG